MEALAACSIINKQTQESLIKLHAPLVKRIAHHLLSHLPPSVQFDDLMQAGMLGVLEAAKHYDLSKGASFETYAGIRIRGHMLDEVRRNDWVPRSVYRNSRLIAQAVKAVENRLGREAKDHEIAKELKLSLADYHSLLQDSVGAQLYSFEDLGVSDDSLYSESNTGCPEPQTKVLREDMISKLTEMIKALPQKEGLVLSLYYQQDLNLKEIGDVLGVGESRVSQIHSQATLRLRERFITSLQ